MLIDGVPSFQNQITLTMISREQRQIIHRTTRSHRHSRVIPIYTAQSHRRQSKAIRSRGLDGQQNHSQATLSSCLSNPQPS